MYRYSSMLQRISTDMRRCSGVMQIEPINAQLEQYKMASATLVKQLGAVSAEKLLSKSLFLVSSGSNDVDDYLMNPALQVLINSTVYISVLIEEYENTLMVS